MHYQGYSIEIVADNSPLAEVTEPADESIISLAKSYISLSNLEMKLESATTHFACVPSVDTSFLIRATCPRTRNMVAEFFVDGRSDERTSHLRDGEATKRGFLSSDYKRRFLFKFSPTMWDDKVVGSRSSGQWNSGPGCITVAFWESSKEKIQSKKARPSFNVEPVRITEGKQTKDLEMTVQFEEEEALKLSSNSLYGWKRVTKDPIAVLHLYYRSAYVLAGKGHDVSLPNANLSSVDEYAPSHSSTSQTGATCSKAKGVKREVDDMEEAAGPSRRRIKQEEDMKTDLILKRGEWSNPIFVESDEENEGGNVIVLD